MALPEKIIIDIETMGIPEYATVDIGTWAGISRSPDPTIGMALPSSKPYPNKTINGIDVSDWSNEEIEALKSNKGYNKCSQGCASIGNIQVYDERHQPVGPAMLCRRCADKILSTLKPRTPEYLDLRHFPNYLHPRYGNLEPDGGTHLISCSYHELGFCSLYPFTLVDPEEERREREAEIAAKASLVSVLGQRLAQMRADWAKKKLAEREAQARLENENRLPYTFYQPVTKRVINGVIKVKAIDIMGSNGPKGGTTWISENGLNQREKQLLRDVEQGFEPNQDGIAQTSDPAVYYDTKTGESGRYVDGKWVSLKESGALQAARGAPDGTPAYVKYPDGKMETGYYIDGVWRSERAIAMDPVLKDRLHEIMIRSAARIR